MATTNASDGGFRRWRRSRPFWGGLLLLIAGLELFLSANLTLGDLEVHMGPEGFLSYLLPLLLVLSGVLSWVTPGQRLFYGILGLLTAVYSLVGLNLGGFGLGMLIGIFGGALVLAWSPTRPAPVAPAPAGSHEDPPSTDRPDEEPAPADHDQRDAGQHGHDPAATMIVPGFHGGPDDRNDDTAPLRPAHRPDPAQQFPDAPAYPSPEHSADGEPPQPPSGGIHRKTFVITLIPLAMTAALLVAGGQSPARADVECPKGLPSRPATEATKEPTKQASPKPSPSDTDTTKQPPASTAPSASTPAGPPAAGEDGDGNPIVDGWNGIVDGVGDLLGIGDEEAAETEGADPAPESSTTTQAPTVPEPTASAPSDEVPPAPRPSGQPGAPAPSASAGSASPSPSASLQDIPCLGPRVFKVAGPDDVPPVSVKRSILETDSLWMYNSTYDGVAQLNTPKGKLAALKFSMRQAVNEPFKLTVPEAGSHTTLIESKKLTTDGNVRFYTPEFKGKLFGVIPVTFTPASPPPLMLPVLWFTDVRIDLAFVRCDTLTGEPLKVSAKA